MVVWNEVTVAPPQSRYHQSDRFHKKRPDLSRQHFVESDDSCGILSSQSGLIK